MVLKNFKQLFYPVMLKTLERYQKCNYGALEPNVSARESLELSCQQEYLRLKARYEALQRTQRNLLGEELGPLSSKELESLERQLDASLKQIRSRRTQCMLDQLSDLQRREQLLHEANKALNQRLMEGYQVNALQLNQYAEEVGGYGHPPPPPPPHAQPHGEAFFHPLECEPTLQMGIYQPDPMSSAVTGGPSTNNFMPGWLP
ncbi:agamous-like MADS-box protein MADS4 isoform X3 [Syzygium oleosum]|uniref:agamous-like MADS-box protein MADS4 isoform X3 n=1 Tax=Syzygium oleosum TaxID=219896 RepID=UPI0024B97A38|nr:agamous-like MADS-box protein MADS4 isoform X3 [Syzygium oleosum]